MQLLGLWSYLYGRDRPHEAVSKLEEHSLQQVWYQVSPTASCSRHWEGYHLDALGLYRMARRFRPAKGKWLVDPWTVWASYIRSPAAIERRSLWWLSPNFARCTPSHSQREQIMKPVRLTLQTRCTDEVSQTRSKYHPYPVTAVQSSEPQPWCVGKEQMQIKTVCRQKLLWDIEWDIE